MILVLLTVIFLLAWIFAPVHRDEYDSLAERKRKIASRGNSNIYRREK